MFTNKLKTRFNSFLQNGFKYKKNSQFTFQEIFPQELNKCLQKFYLPVRKRDGRQFDHYASKLATVNELKIIIFVLNYLTVLIYTKTIPQCRWLVWIFTWPLRGSVNKCIPLATSTSVNNCYL